MRARALTILLAVVVMTGCHRVPEVATAPVHHFAIVLERSATGWSARCETGCAWTEVTETCAGCDIRLDATGISRAYPARPGAEGFEFVVSGERQGWSARAVRGVTWVTLSWTCTTATCRARVDETGVRSA
jgi:hypothetical protein